MRRPISRAASTRSSVRSSGCYEELPAEGRRTVAFQAPTTPGTYDIYCDTCCGGKDSPTMHGAIVVEA